MFRPACRFQHFATPNPHPIFANRRSLAFRLTDLCQWNQQSFLLRFVLILGICGLFFFSRAGSICAEEIALAQGQPQQVRLRILEADSKQPVAARVYIQHANGTWYFPKPASSAGTAIPYQRQRPDKIEEMHSTLSADPFDVSLPAGRYKFTVERGKEYLPKTIEVDIPLAQPQLDIEISRWIHMAKLGWYSGDTHLHREYGEMANLVMAEDLNVGFPLSHWITSADTDPVNGNRIKNTSGRALPAVIAPVAVDATHFIYPLNTEYEIFTVKGKSHTLGAFVVIGHQKPFDIKVPNVVPVAERAHREGGLIDLEKHSWPWSLAIVPLMKVDLFELANNHCWRTDFALRQWTIDAADDSMRLEKETAGLTEWGWIDFGFQTYYALLNCGFRLQPTAGTGSGVHPVPAGFGRVYVQVPGELTYEKWISGLRAGQSFVTTGPMLFVTINGQSPGHVFQNAAVDGQYRIQGRAISPLPVSRIEIIVNGEVVKTLETKVIGTSSGTIDVSFDEVITVPGSGWIAVRCFDDVPKKRVRFAHTSPVHIEVKDRPLYPRTNEIEYIIRRIKEEIARNRGVIDDAALSEYQQALQFYELKRPPESEVKK